MIINDLDDYYIVFDTKNRNIELDTLINNGNPINAPWARNIKNGHYDHIHISIPK